MTAPRTTVCIVPRERFSAAIASLEALLDDADAPQRIVYVDAGSPRPIASQLLRMAQANDITLLRTDHFLSPNSARNVALPRATTEFAAFMDNDVFVSDGWIPRLEAAADETGAAVVAPIYGVAKGDLGRTVVHLAGAANRLVGPPGNRRHEMEFIHEGKDPDEVAAGLVRRPTEQAEFHLFFVRKDELVAAGGLDEDLRSINEHLDVALRITQRGGEIWLEPSVLATYLVAERLTLADRRYYLQRWSRGWNEQSDRAFRERWGIDPDDPAHAVLVRSVNLKRLPAYRPYRSVLGRVMGQLGRASRSLPDRTLGPAVAWWEDRRTAAGGPPRLLHRASWDPT